MSIQRVIDRIDEYERIYLEGQRKISDVMGNKDMNQEVKRRKAAEIKERYTPQVEGAVGRVLEEIERTQVEVRAARQKAIREGMSRAAEVELIQKGIRSGDYGASYVADLIAVYQGDPIMMTAIKSAASVKGSKASEEVKNLAAAIPEDRTDKIIKGLTKASEKIIAAPKLGDSIHIDNWSAALWANGTSIDSLKTFLLGLDGVKQVIEESEEQAAVDTEELQRIFTDHNTGIKFGNN